MSATLAAVAARLAAQRLLAGPVPPAAAQLALTDATTDSRRVEPGALFCALAGTHGDGHGFLAAARAAGAAAALVERPDAALALPQLVVTDGRRAAAFAAAAVFADPWDELTLVGVTGTNGKTTSAAILRHLLGARGAAASLGTLGLVGADGSVRPGSEGLTTPGPADAARWLRALADEGTRAVAMEVSSHALDQARVAALRFDAAVFTNLTRDHLDYHGTLEAYRAAKLKLAGLLQPGGAAVVNADDPAWAGIEAPGARVVRFGLVAPDAEVRAEEVRATPAGMRWRLRTPDGAAEVRLPLFGAYNVANALGAAAALWSLGWPPAQLATRLETLPQVPGRLELVPAPAGAPTVLIDYAHTPDALQRALQALRPLTRGRLIVVFGAGGDRDRGKRPQMGRVAAAHADLAVVTSDNPRGEDPAAIAAEIEAGMGSAPRLRVLDRRAAIARALDAAAAGDVVLLAGKGHETYQLWGTEVRPFDERVVVRELFAEKENRS